MTHTRDNDTTTAGAASYRHSRQPTFSGRSNYRLCRYADDWCLTVSGTKQHAQTLRDEIAEVLSTVGLRLSAEKTLITHIDDGLDFLSWRIQRHTKKGTSKDYVYTYPAKKALRAIARKVKTWCRQIGTNNPLDVLLQGLNPMLRGWCVHFRYGVSSASFAYLRRYVWQTVWKWLRRKHPKATRKKLRTRYCAGGWWPSGDERTMFDPATVSTIRYRYRGNVIPSPWPTSACGTGCQMGLVESPLPGQLARRVRGAG